jgi:hypothetical protein
MLTPMGLSDRVAERFTERQKRYGNQIVVVLLAVMFAFIHLSFVGWGIAVIGPGGWDHLGGLRFVGGGLLIAGGLYGAVWVPRLIRALWEEASDGADEQGPSG